MVRGILFYAAMAAVVLFAMVLAVDACEISYYSGGRHEGGSRTATGDRIGPLTAASPSLRLGSRVRVTTGFGSATLRVNDRGPARWTRRCLDVSADSARTLGLVGPGHLDAMVEQIR